jgi:hypothetical protein
MLKRPSSVTILALIVLTFTILNALRFYETLLGWEILKQYSSWPGPLYMAAVSLVWILIGLPLTFWILRGNSRSPLFLKLALYSYIAWFWVDRLIFQHRLVAYLFPLLGTVFMLLFVFLLLKCRENQNFFRERDNHDR